MNAETKRPVAVLVKAKFSFDPIPIAEVFSPCYKTPVSHPRFREWAGDDDDRWLTMPLVVKRDVWLSDDINFLTDRFTVRICCSDSEWDEQKIALERNIIEAIRTNEPRYVRLVSSEGTFADYEITPLEQIPPLLNAAAFGPVADLFVEAIAKANATNNP